jgi:hypothetical protein
MMCRAVTGLLSASVAVCAEAAGLTEAPSTGQLTVFALTFAVVFALQWMSNTSARSEKSPLPSHIITSGRWSLLFPKKSTRANTRKLCGLGLVAH